MMSKAHFVSPFKNQHFPNFSTFFKKKASFFKKVAIFEKKNYFFSKMKINIDYRALLCFREGTKVLLSEKKNFFFHMPNC